MVKSDKSSEVKTIKTTVRLSDGQYGQMFTFDAKSCWIDSSQRVLHVELPNGTNYAFSLYNMMWVKQE